MNANGVRLRNPSPPARSGCRAFKRRGIRDTLHRKRYQTKKRKYQRALVPYTLGQKLFAAAREPKRFVRVAGAGHDEVLDDAPFVGLVIDEMTRFVRERLETGLAPVASS